ncbi:MAG: HAD family hydrolase [Candidatus Micrarchaeia archaeon]
MVVASFDLDGTLADTHFDQILWFKAIPEAYARKQGMPFPEALDHCKRAYDLESDASLRWYDVNHWLALFGLESEKKHLLEGSPRLSRLFPDAIPALESLKSRGCRIIIFSGAMHEFIRLKLQEDFLEEYFEGVYSATEDFKSVKKEAPVFSALCERLGVSPEELWHVGNNHLFDYQAPRSLGVNAFYLDREKNEKGEHVVHDLKEFAAKVLEC